jgi:hypothetical protein
MHATGEYTIADLMEVFSIGRATRLPRPGARLDAAAEPGRRVAMMPGVRRTRTGLADWPAISRE